MILIELESGSQQLFQSPAELAAAIRRGELGPGARIYHRSSAQWLPVTVHPEFRKIVEEQASVPLPPLARTRWTFFATDSTEAPGQPRGQTSGMQSADPESLPLAISQQQSDQPALRRALGRAMQYIRRPAQP